MGLLWKFAKIVIVLAIAVPLLMIALTAALGILGALSALAFLVLRVAIVGLIVFGAIKLVIAMFGGGSRSGKRAEVKPLPPADPHYEAAMRELDRELGEVPRSS